jgi:hypothetical protein
MRKVSAERDAPQTLSRFSSARGSSVPDTYPLAAPGRQVVAERANPELLSGALRFEVGDDVPHLTVVVLHPNIGQPYVASVSNVMSVGDDAVERVLSLSDQVTLKIFGPLAVECSRHLTELRSIGIRESVKLPLDIACNLWVRASTGVFGIDVARCLLNEARDENAQIP